MLLLCLIDEKKVFEGVFFDVVKWVILFVMFRSGDVD